MSVSNTNFFIQDTCTVPEGYRWDDGPLLTDMLPLTDMDINDVEDVVASTENDLNVQILGNSPLSYISVMSEYEPNPKTIAVKRVYDFGDYYNSESNVVVSNCFEDEEICHTYIMPGTYTLTVTTTEYLLKDRIDPSLTFASEGNDPEVILPDVFWQWRNFKCDNDINPLNKKVKWSSEYCQQIQWKHTMPCIKQQGCSWDETCIPEEDFSDCLNPGPISLAGYGVTMRSIDCTNAEQHGINQTCDRCHTHYLPQLELTSKVSQQKKLIKVAEIPPVAYLDVTQTSALTARVSPYTVRLSSKNTQSGSFPIERIDWDPGDGTPIKTVYRWSNSIASEFIYNGVYADDYKDPRNYDLVHTYTAPPGSVSTTFYPSITCYTSSTAATDCAKNIVGPMLEFADASSVPSTEEDVQLNTVRLLQNELNNNGRVLLGELNNNTVVVWRYNK